MSDDTIECCPYCQTYHYYWGWRAEGLASEYKPVRVCLRTGKEVEDEHGE